MASTIKVDIVSAEEEIFSGEAHMVDIADKDVTARRAVAAGRF